MPRINRYPMQIYTNPKDIFNSLLAIGPDAVLLANPEAEHLDKAVELVKTGAVAQLKDAKAIPVNAITRVRYNEKHPTEFDIAYKAGKDSKTANFSFTTTEERATAFAALKATLSGATEKREELNVVTAAIKPLIFTLIFAGLTYAFYMGAKDLQTGGEADTSGRRGLIKQVFAWLMDVLGPTGVLIVGGLIVAICLVALVKRVGNPPVFVSLVRK